MIDLTAIWIASIIASTAIGAWKGSPIAGFLCGLILGPIGAVLALFAAGTRSPCPHCREPVKRGASLCPHCRSTLSAAPGS